MIDGNTSYQNYAIDDQEGDSDDRLPLGTSMLAVALLSLLGWAIMLIPAIAIFH